MATNRGEVTGRKPQAEEKLVLSVPEAGRLLGLSRNSAYEAAGRGDIPTIRIGGRILVPRIALLRMLEVTTVKREIEAA
jgi:excisionase family DNA binding protein